jgi:hypothetical protein
MPPTTSTMPRPFRQTGLPERCPRCGQASDCWVFTGGIQLCSSCYGELTSGKEPVNLNPGLAEGTGATKGPTVDTIRRGAQGEIPRGWDSGK